MSEMTLQALIDDLQNKLAFQEDTIDRLNDALTAQQAQLSKLQEQMRLVVEKLSALEQRQPEAPGEEPPPPHY